MKKKIDFFEFGGYYMSVYQFVNDSLTDDNDALGGKLRLTSTLTPFRSKTGNFGRLAFTLDHRHRFTNIASTELAEQIGYLGQTQVVLSDAGLTVVHLNWAQGFRGGDAGFIIGRIDPNDYFDVLGYSSPWTGFANSTIQLNASLSFQQSSWGLLGGNWFNDQWYVIAGVFDANGSAEDNLEFFSGGSELFTQFEVGWAPSKEERLKRKINISFWHKDERVDAGKDFGKGLLLTAGWSFDQWTTFLRVGFSEGEAPAYNQSVTTGFQYDFSSSDQLGLGFNWGNPSNDSLPSQISTEFYYRFQVLQNLAITPNVQWLKNPALNTQTDNVWAFGLRTRFTF